MALRRVVPNRSYPSRYQRYTVSERLEGLSLVSPRNSWTLATSSALMPALVLTHHTGRHTDTDHPSRTRHEREPDVRGEPGPGEFQDRVKGRSGRRRGGSGGAVRRAGFPLRMSRRVQLATCGCVGRTMLIFSRTSSCSQTRRRTRRRCLRVWALRCSEREQGGDVDRIGSRRMDGWTNGHAQHCVI